MTELWKPVVGWEGEYEVSDHGRIRSLDRVLSDGRMWKGRVLRTVVRHDLYPRVVLRKDGKKHNLFVHRMVLEAFTGPCPDGMEACHHNGVRGDNRISNLRWDTRVANMKDRDRHGNTRNQNSGKTHCGRCGLPYAGRNLIQRSNGRRACRKCTYRRTVEHQRRSRKKKQLRELTGVHL